MPMHGQHDVDPYHQADRRRELGDNHCGLLLGWQLLVQHNHDGVKMPTGRQQSGLSLRVFYGNVHGCAVRLL